MRNASREKYHFFHFIEMLSKSIFMFTFSLANILHTTAFFTTCKNINYFFRTSVQIRRNYNRKLSTIDSGTNG